MTFRLSEFGNLVMLWYLAKYVMRWAIPTIVNAKAGCPDVMSVLALWDPV